MGLSVDVPPVSTIAMILIAGLLLSFACWAVRLLSLSMAAVTSPIYFVKSLLSTTNQEPASGPMDGNKPYLISISESGRQSAKRLRVSDTELESVLSSSDKSYSCSPARPCERA